MNILLQCGMDEKAIFSDDYINNECLDSIMMADIIFSIEDKFGIEISTEEIIPENFHNFSTIMKMIRRLVDNNGR